MHVPLLKLTLHYVLHAAARFHLEMIDRATELIIAHVPFLAHYHVSRSSSEPFSVSLSKYEPIYTFSQGEDPGLHGYALRHAELCAIVPPSR